MSYEYRDGMANVTCLVLGQGADVDGTGRIALLWCTGSVRTGIGKRLISGREG